MATGGKYQKQRLIGSGERVDVFLGLNVAFGRKVAIKELRGGVETSSAERNSFYADYEKWATLENPRLARIEDIDKTRAWIVQEYLPQSIGDQATELCNNPEALFLAFEQLLEGLSALHGMNFLHCNLKTSNVRVANDGVKLCDGRCVPIGFPGSLPKPRGSNCYLAPEMINEEFGSVGTASDIYVAGTIMLKILAGESFETLFKGYVSGTPDTEMGWVRWHNSPEALEPVHSLLPSFPKELADLIDGMICKPVQTRFASAERVLSDLRAHREAIINAPKMAVAAPAVTPSPAAASSASAQKPPSPAPGRPAKEVPQTIMAAPIMAAPIPVAESKVNLIDRPNAASYVRCLSGTLAGSIFPTAMGDILIGEGEQCQVRLDAELYPPIQGREIKISLGGNGWQVADTRNHPLVVDAKKTFDPAPIRSGSIFRISPRGPDFQFIVQGKHEWTWQDIASELQLLRPETSSVPARLMKKDGQGPAPNATSSPAPPAPQPVATGARQASASAAPARPQFIPPKGKTKSAKAAKTAKAAKSNAPAAPTKRAGGADAAAPQPRSPKASVASGEVKPSMIEKFKAMEKNKRNNVVLVVVLAAMVLISILIIAILPRDDKDKPTDDQPSGDNAAAVEKNDSAENSPAASNEPAANAADPQ